MKKQLTTQPEIKLIGLTARTNNQNEMNPSTAKIGGLVGQFFGGNMAAKIANRAKPGVTLSVYTNYDSNELGDYTYFIGEEVNSFDEVPAGFETLTIPASKYQKFTTEAGKMPDVVIDAWMKIWKMSSEDLGGSRTYVADFEIYDQRAADPMNASLDVFIGIK